MPRSRVEGDGVTLKILHVYASNLTLFEQALEGTGCHINGSVDSEYLRKSFTNYNARDTMGLIVFKSPMTKRTVKLIKHFDDLFVFTPMPIVVISDQATELYQSGLLRVKNSPLFLVNSFENTISDIDLNRIFTTLACMSSDMYEMGDLELSRAKKSQNISKSEITAASLAEEVLATYAKLGGRKLDEDYSKEGERELRKYGVVGKS